MTNASALLEAMAEPTRRALVERLATGPAAVTELANELPISRSAVSQHLQVLKAVGLVADRADGTRRVYHVDPDALAIVRAYFDSFWRRSLDSFERVVNHSEETP
jgi:DNA-binding transcriptional ArsR family regulator